MHGEDACICSAGKLKMRKLPPGSCTSSHSMYNKASLLASKVYLYNKKQTMLLHIHRAFEISTLCLQILYKDNSRVEVDSQTVAILYRLMIRSAIHRGLHLQLCR